MKKLIISIVAVAAMAFSANAKLYVGGSVGLGLTASKASTIFSFSLSPEVGYNFNDKFAAGAALNFTPQSQTSNNVTVSAFAWEIAPYARFKFVNIGKLNLFGDARIGLGTDGSSNSANGYSTNSKVVFRWDIGFYPGISYSFTNKWAIVSHIAGISYGGTKGGSAFNLSILNGATIGFFYSF